MKFEEEWSFLNPYQMTAVLDESPACVVNANVGSGKTTVLIAKILYLYQVKQIQPEEMIVLTFTNKAADEIKERLIAKEKFLKKEKNLEIILFVIFFIPGTPKDILTYLAPFTRLKLSSFIFITSIARIPSVITSTIGGNAISNQNYRFTIFIFVITGIISIFGLLSYKRYIKKKNL